MGDLIRLFEGLRAGDPTAEAVLLFALGGTVVIAAIAVIVRRRRG